MKNYQTLYASSVDFADLASEDSEFAEYFKDDTLDFSDPAAFKQLTRSLLKRDFDLTVELPDDRLCPPVPNRLNYILWLQDLLDSSSESLSELFEPQRVVTGLDIGTGSSCIYPLLGCRLRQEWRFIATDVDVKNLENAKGNVRRNGLDERVKVYGSTALGPLIPLDALRIEKIDFVMTNPPFYTSTRSMLESAEAKARPPLTACTGAEIEMVVEGGEVAFVRRVIEESIVLNDKVQWYSAMLGKLESVRELIELLDGYGLNDVREGERGTANWAVKEFVQGSKTRRWGLAWSWRRLRPSVSASRGTKSLGKQLLPFPSLFSLDVTESASDEDTGNQLNQLMSSLELQWRYKSNLLTGVAFAEKNVWSRAARRSRDRKMGIDSNGHSPDEEDLDPALAVKISVKSSGVLRAAVSIDVRWLIGRDSVLFESFCGMVKREFSRTKQ